MKFAENETRRYQWDSNVKLQCDDYPAGREFQFENQVLDGAFVTQLGDDKSVVIPNELFQHAVPITAYAMDAEGTYTVEAVRIGVRPRNKPDDYAYTTQEVKTWQELAEQIKALQTSVDWIIEQLKDKG